MKTPLLVAVLVLGTLGQPRSAVKPVDYGPLPGKTLAEFSKVRKGLVSTGGIAVPSIKPGFSFEVWEDHLGKEYRFSPTFLVCDPSDSKGVVYVPKTTLLIQRQPDGKKVVVGEKRAFMVRTDEDVDRKLEEEEKFVAAHQIPPKGPVARVKDWWRRNVSKEPYMQYVFDDGRSVIAKGEVWLESGTMVELVLAPFFAGADLTGKPPGEGEAPPAEDAEPTPAPTPIATDSLRAPMKIIRYLKPYESLVLEDLAPYVDDKRKKPRRKPLYSH
jgi:hypothetical protein